MTRDQKPPKNRKITLSSWAGAGVAVGFASGYLSLGSLVSGVILAIGLGVAMGMAGRSYSKRR